MPSTAQSTQFDTLTPIQIQVLESLVAGRSISAAAREAGVHRTTFELQPGHLWTRTLPDFARALLTLRQQRADQMLDELGDLADLAINTFRQILSDENTSASVRLKAAIEIAKLVESQRPTVFFEPAVERLHQDLSLAEVKHPRKPASAPVGRNAPCPCGSPLKYKRCCGNPVSQARAA